MAFGGDNCGAKEKNTAFIYLQDFSAKQRTLVINVYIESF